MSLSSPHQIFGRLQELKKWQHTHEKLLKRSSYENDFEKTSFNNSLPHDRSENNNSDITEANSSTLSPGQMKLLPSPDKDFTELLEQKLNEYDSEQQPQFVPSEGGDEKPKKPFLRKGSGLSKYKLKPEEYKRMIGCKYSNTIVGAKKRPKSVEIWKRPQKNMCRPKTGDGEKFSINKNKKFVHRPNNLIKATKNAAAKPKNEYNNNNNREYLKKIDTKSQVDEEKNSIKTSAKVVSEKPKVPDKKLVNNKEKVHDEEPKKSEKLQPVVTDKKNSPKLSNFLETISKKNQESVSDFTPLKVPDFSIQTKGNWCDIDRNNRKFEGVDNLLIDKYCQDDNSEGFFGDEKYTQSPVLVHSKWRNSVQQVSGYTLNKRTNVMWNSADRIQNQQLIPNSENTSRESLSYESSKNNDQILYEKALEAELMIFEALERRIDQSGFSSTNTSIIQLLASTPSKLNLKKNAATSIDYGPIFENEANNHVVIDTDDNRAVGCRSPVINGGESESYGTPSEGSRGEDESSSNWRRKNNDFGSISSNEDDEADEADDTMVSERSGNAVRLGLNTEEKYEKNVEIFETVGSVCSSTSVNSGNSDVSYNCYGNNYSEVKEVYRYSCDGENRDVSTLESCQKCGFLIKRKIEECQSELDCLRIEKDKIVAIRERMDDERKEFEREMKNRRRQFEEQRLKFQLEIEEEKKKTELNKINEKPNREVKAKLLQQNKKDREEINNLKMELNEVKEMMKLRETKNAMSIARLRNQVKLLEKNNFELKTENEKLLKEKAKLLAQQKTQSKTVETKMLKEISKNISKLTEETFKNQNFKNESSSEEDTKRKLTKNVDNCGKSSLDNYYSKDISNKSNIKQLHSSFGNENSENVEETYRNLFGGQEVITIEDNSKNDSFPSQNRPVGLEKTENVLEDGTKEIKYSNGNKKLISINGTIRYYYSSNDTWHTNFPDGTEVIEFPNGQSEQRFKDGKCLIFFPDGPIQTIFPDGTEEVKYPDGSKLLTKKDGERLLLLSNGQVEIHATDGQKRREYPDGTVKILYTDGTQETRYSNGRVRMKNGKGEVILDTEEQNAN